MSDSVNTGFVTTVQCTDVLDDTATHVIV